MDNIYTTNEYLKKNPSLHEEDSPWKIEKIIPMVDKFIGHIDKKEINLLDVGGGAGLILKAVSAYIEEKHGKKVNKFSLDLSPKMLETQKANNPDLKLALNEDVRDTSLANKKIDLALMIDVLEHIPEPIRALAEIRRISKYIIFKVPLEDNLFNRIYDLFNNNKIKKYSFETFGHINTYNLSKLFGQITGFAGQVINYYFANSCDYLRKSAYYQSSQTARSKLIYFLISSLFKVSPRLSSIIYADSAIALVRCYE